MEDGLDPVKEYLGTLFGVDLHAVPMPHIFRRQGSSESQVELLTASSRRALEEIYEADFEAWGY